MMGAILLLQHMTIPIPRCESVASFYTTVLGFSQGTKGSATDVSDLQKRAISINARATQIHLLLTEGGKAMPGVTIRLVYPNLEKLCEFLSLQKISYSSLHVESSCKENDDLKSIRFQCPIGNCFVASEGPCPTPQSWSRPGSENSE